MDTEMKCLIAEKVGEGILGYAIGTAVANTILPKCETKHEVVALAIGTGIVSWMTGRAFAKQFLKFCDEMFDTDFKDDIEKL